MEVAQRSRLSTGCLCALVAALLFIAGLIVWMCVDSSRGFTVDRLEALIAAEIPRGANREQVEQRFDVHRIKYQYIAGGVDDSVGHVSITELAGLKDVQISGCVRGRIEGDQANVGFINNGRITIYFFLTEKGEVAGHYIDEFILSF